MPTVPIPSRRPKRRRPLYQIIIAASAVAVAVGTISWTAIELASGQPLSGRELMFHHVVPAIVIGLIIAVVLSLLLNRLVVDPIQNLFSHLYRIGSGRLDPIDLDTGVEEIQTMADGVNLLARRLQAPGGNEAYARAQERLAKLRRQLRSMADAGGEEKELFLDLAREMRALEADLLAIGSPARST